MKNTNVVGVSAKNAGTWDTLAKNAVGADTNFQHETIDENYLPILKIPLIAGRNFSTAYPDESIQPAID